MNVCGVADLDLSQRPVVPSLFSSTRYKLLCSTVVVLTLGHRCSKVRGHRSDSSGSKMVRIAVGRVSSGACGTTVVEQQHIYLLYRAER